MIFFYTIVLIILGILKFLVERRAAFLEWRHARVANSVDELLHAPVFKEGNSNRIDPGKAAQRQFLLGLMVQKKDRLEARHFTWLNWSEKLARGIDRLRNWKGKKLPYTLGALDIWLFLYLVDYFGVAEFVSTRKLIETITSMLSN